jgi:3-deoxy-D-manno-octulosonic-acid transferase
MLLFFYNLLLPFALLISFPFYLRRILKRGNYARNFGQRFGLYSKPLQARFVEGKWIWIRAVSVGEVGMAMRLLHELRKQDPTLRALISTTTSTGYLLGLEQAQNQEWAEVIYSPIDFLPIVKTCWNRIRPRAVIMIDSDLWPSFLAVARGSRTPIFLANARLSQRSERRYRLLRLLTQPLLWDHVTTLFAQDEVDAQRWAETGVSTDRIITTGSMKYDTEDFVSQNNPRFIQWLEERGINSARPVLLGGSLHPGEEELLLSCFELLRSEFPDLFLILVPRHAERSPEIAKLLEKERIAFALRSDPQISKSASVLVVNSTGELKDWYQTATVVVVGKSFCGIGGQNPVEPILANKPVIVGPHMENFQFLVEELRKGGGIIQLETVERLPATVADLFRNPAHATMLVERAAKALAFHKGSIRRTASRILAWKAQKGEQPR